MNGGRTRTKGKGGNDEARKQVVAIVRRRLRGGERQREEVQRGRR